MTEEDKHQECSHPHHGGGGDLNTDDLGAAEKSLTDALRASFVILKVIMVVVVIAVLGNGFQTIGPDEQGILLRFGKVQVVDGEGGKAIGPGLRWTFPYPIDELVKIPVEQEMDLPVNSFWYYRTPNELLSGETSQRARGPKLHPVNDGYALTCGARRVAGEEGSEPQGDDYNIVHSRWRVFYKVDDVYRFYKNVLVSDPKPGDVYGDLMQESVMPLLTSCFEDAVVSALVRYTIDEAIESEGKIREEVLRRVRENMREIESGLSVVNVTLRDMHWPRQVNEAFEASIAASQDAKTQMTEAEAAAQTLLNECAGPVARELASRLRQGSLDDAQLEPYWERLAGSAQAIISEAEAYRTSIVESARSSAEVFQQLLPRFLEQPELVVSDLYQAAMREIMANIDEKLLLSPDAGHRADQLRIMINRDPTLQRKKNRNEETATQ